MLIQKGMKLLFFGDSLTRRTGLLESPNPACRYSLDYRESYVDFVMKRLLVHHPELELQFFNRGIGGDTVEDLISRYQQDVLPVSPDLTILLIGQNDVRSYGADRFEAGLHELLGLFKRDRIPVVQLSTTAHRDADKMKKLAELDPIIRRLCNEFENGFVDLKSPMERILNYNSNTETPIELFTSGSHLSELGNILVADTVYEFLTQKDSNTLL